MSSSLFSQQRSSSQGGALTRQPERGGKECPKLLIIGLRALLSLLGQLGVIVHCFRGSKAGIMQCDILLKILAINFFLFLLQVAAHLFQAGANIVKLGIQKTVTMSEDTVEEFLGSY